MGSEMCIRDRPMFVLFIEVDPILVDVNVHPRKLEVKFAEPGDVFGAVKSTVMEGLRSFSMGQNEMAGVVRSFANFKASGSAPKASFNFRQPAYSQTTSHSPTFAERHQNTKYEIPDTSAPIPVDHGPLKVICQLEKKYILASSEQGVFFFDQHALHERQRFEIFWQEYKASEPQTQKLLVPQRVYLSESDISLLNEKKTDLATLGLLVQFPADNCVAVLEIPQILENEDLKLSLIHI